MSNSKLWTEAIQLRPDIESESTVVKVLISSLVDYLISLRFTNSLATPTAVLDNWSIFHPHRTRSICTSPVYHPHRKD